MIFTLRREFLHRLYDPSVGYMRLGLRHAVSTALERFMYECNNLLRLKSEKAASSHICRMLRSKDDLRICMRFVQRGSFVNQGPEHIPISACYGVFLKLHRDFIVGFYSRRERMQMMHPTAQRLSDP